MPFGFILFCHETFINSILINYTMSCVVSNLHENRKSFISLEKHDKFNLRFIDSCFVCRRIIRSVINR